MVLLLYSATAALLLWLTHRFVRPLSRGAAGFLFLLPFLFTGYALVAGRIYAPIDHPYKTEPLVELKEQYGIGRAHNGFLVDIYSQMIPWRKAVQWSLSHGEWPLWNPFILSGDVLAATAQPAAFSPFTLVACLLPAALSFTFSAAMGFLIGGAGAFLFARELECSEEASVVAAVGFAYSTGMAFFILWPLGFSWAFFPLLLLGARRVVHDPGMSAGVLLATTLVLLLFAGHPETVFHIVVAGTAYALLELKRRAGFRLRALGTALAAGTIALLLSAIYLLPVLEAIPQTADYASRVGAAGADHGKSGIEAAARVAADYHPFLFLRKWAKPEMLDERATSAAVGSIILALAIYAVVRLRSSATWLFAAMYLVFEVIQTEWWPIARVLQKLPLFKLALHDRLSFAAAFCLTVLAALGCEHIIRTDDRRRAAFTLSIVLAVLAGSTFAVLSFIELTGSAAVWQKRKIVGELLFLGLTVIVLLIPLRPRVAIVSIVLCLLIQRVVEEGDVYKSFPARAAYPPIPILEPLKNVERPFRITGHGYSLLPATNTLYELEDVRGYQAMTFHELVETYRIWCLRQPVWFNRVDDLTRPFLSFLNVRFAIAAASTPLPPGWRIVATTPQTVLLENENVIERAFVPRQVTLGLDSVTVVDRMAEATDFRERAWIAAEVTPFDRPNGPGRLRVRRENTAYDIDAQMDGDGWVVVSETAWAGWRAYVDGRRVKTTKANAAFLSVYLPRGRHHVRLVYLPQSFVAGRAVSLGTLIVIVSWCVWRRWRMREAAWPNG